MTLIKQWHMSDIKCSLVLKFYHILDYEFLHYCKCGSHQCRFPNILILPPSQQFQLLETSKELRKCWIKTPSPRHHFVWSCPRSLAQCPLRWPCSVLVDRYPPLLNSQGSKMLYLWKSCQSAAGRSHAWYQGESNFQDEPEKEIDLWSRRFPISETVWIWLL